MSKLDSKIQAKALYVIATPIGNLGDISQRAIEVLSQVDVLLVEDTRHSGLLLSKLGIKKPLLSLHEHNEKDMCKDVLARIKQGETMALLSDAGTPLIRDPGYHLVRLAHEKKVKVIPIPGPCALIAALSVSGLPSDAFTFLGFLPIKKNERMERLKAVQHETRTLIFYEAPHRILEVIEEMNDVFGKTREGVIAKELTKTFETVQKGSLDFLLHWLKNDATIKGEFVILLEGLSKKSMKHSLVDSHAQAVLKILLKELPIKQAAKLAAQLCQSSKKELYQEALKLKNNDPS